MREIQNGGKRTSKKGGIHEQTRVFRGTGGRNRRGYLIGKDGRLGRWEMNGWSGRHGFRSLIGENDE